MTAQPGYVEHRLHRALHDTASYRFVKVAIWSSEQDWAGARDEGFRALVVQPVWREFPALPGLYEVVHDGTRTDAGVG